MLDVLLDSWGLLQGIINQGYLSSFERKSGPFFFLVNGDHWWFVSQK